MARKTSTSTVSRRKYIEGIAGVAGGALLAGCSGSGSGGGGKTYIGYSNFTNSDPFEVMVRKVSEWYGSDQNDIKFEATAADGSTSQQIQDCQNLLRKGVDGLIITPTDSNGLAKIAKEADVPVFSVDIPVNSKKIKLHTGVNQNKYGYKAGKNLVEVMKSTYDVKQLNVLEIMMDQDNSNAVMRHESFNRAIDEQGDVSVIKRIEIDGYSASDVASKATSWLQTNPDLHGVYAPWAGGPQGVLTAFDQHGMKTKKGEDGHVVIVSNDADAAVIDALKEGYIDAVIDQPVTFYGPLGIHFAKQYIEKGKGTLPKIGDKVAGDDINLTGNKHQGTTIWKDQLWAPATVRELVTFGGTKLGSPFLTTNAPIVDRKIADEPYLWGNLTRDN